MADEFIGIRNFVKTLEDIQRDQEVNPMAIAMAVLATAKALAPLGIRGVHMLKRMTGGTDEDVKELFRQVDAASPMESGTNSSTSPLEPRKIKFGEITPEQIQDAKDYSQNPWNMINPWFNLERIPKKYRFELKIPS